LVTVGRIPSRVFVGCSSESEIYAKAFSEELKGLADVVPWRDAEEFKPTQNILNALSKAAGNYDFGVLIFAPDDITLSRATRSRSTRDNVLFEFGLFLGELGPNRTFGLIQGSERKKERVKLPSDLGGVIMPQYRPPPGKPPQILKQAKASIKPAAEKIGKVIDAEGPNIHMDLLESFGYIEKQYSFNMSLKAEKISRYIGKLKGKRLLVVARKDFQGSIAEEDKEIAKSKITPIPNYVTQSLSLNASSNPRFDNSQNVKMKVIQALLRHSPLFPAPLEAPSSPIYA